MHRTTLLPRPPGWSFVLGFVLSALAQPAMAQDLGRPQLPAFAQQIKDFADVKDAKAGVKEAPEPYILVLPKDSTRQIEMSTKELISEFRSENPRVVKVQALLDNPRAVLVSGIGSGSTRVYITDNKKNTESLEVRVPLDEEADREAKRGELLEQIHKAVPTASVDVLASGNNTVVLTGVVPLPETAQVLIDLARGVFGPAANVVNAMRIGGIQQVQLEVTIARVNRSKARNFGFSWVQAGNHHFVASTIGGAGTLNNSGTTTLPSVIFPVAALTSTPNAVFGIFNDKESFMGYLNALTTEGLAKLISEPRVITMSGRPAFIVSGGETPILTTSGTGAPSVTYKTFGTVVNFLPIVLGNGKIHLDVRPEISNINAAVGISISSSVGTTTVPGFDVRSAQVSVEMEDGLTLAIGGLIQNTINGQNSKVPILGDIPILAACFTSKTYTETEEELIILVTPHLIDAMACTQLPKYLPGRETRSPDDYELFLEGILEAPRGQRNLTCPYTAAYLNGPSSGKYPCGDTSPSLGGCVGGCNTGLGVGSCGAGNCGAGNCGSGTCGPNGCSPAAGKVLPNHAVVGSGNPEIRMAVDTSKETFQPGPTSTAIPVSTVTRTPTVMPASIPGMLPGTEPTSVVVPAPPPTTGAVFGPAILTDPR